MHKSSFQAMEKFKNLYLNKEDNLKILDIGAYDSSGTNYNYGRFLREKNWQYNGMDIQKGPNVDIVVSNIYKWDEIEDESYDVVISGQAFEHMEFFWKAIKEVERILKVGGFCCIIAPSDGPKHGAVNTDCYRFYEDGMKAIAHYVNFEILHVSTNVDAKPWCDSCLIAKKAGILPTTSKDINKRLNHIENKLNGVLKSIKK